MSHQWDEFSKALAGDVLPRRETLRRLGLAITATALAPLGVEFARAGHKPGGSKDLCKGFCKCRKGKQQDQCLKACKACGNNPARLGGSCGSYFCCGEGQVSCGDYCADLASDRYNCGDCGYACDPPGDYEHVLCIEGRCEYVCEWYTERCNGRCTRLEWDPNNCGACGNVCTGPDPHCSEGVCHECIPGHTPCGDVCVDLAWDRDNCGACGNVCGGETPHCAYGECADCIAGYLNCGDGCIDVMSDQYNCGACGNVCESYEYCYAGACLTIYDYGPPYGGWGWGGYYGWY